MRFCGAECYINKHIQPWATMLVSYDVTNIYTLASRGSLVDKLSKIISEGTMKYHSSF